MGNSVGFFPLKNRFVNSKNTENSGAIVKNSGWNKMDLVSVLALPVTGYVTSSKPQFPHLLNRNNNSAYLGGYHRGYQDNAGEA